MPTGGSVKTNGQLPTTALNMLSQVSQAQAGGQTVRVRNGKVEARESIEPLEILNNEELRSKLDANYLNSLKDVTVSLKKEILEKSGPVTLKYVEKKVPELSKLTHKTEAKALKKAIEKAYSEKALDAATRIDSVLKGANPVVDHPVQAENFEDYTEGLKLRGDSLAEEFAPGGTAWALVEELTNIPSKIPTEEAMGARILLKADIRAYITDNGVLPDRSEVLDMAIDRARYIFPDIAKDLPKFGGRVDNDFQDRASKLGFRDFPTETVRGYVEGLARTSIDSPWDGPKEHRDPPTSPLRTHYNGDFQKAMYEIWSNNELMLNAYGEHLSEKLAEINQTPTTPDNYKEQLEAKLKLFTPDSKLFTYLKSFNGNPSLNGESAGEYLRLVSKQLEDNTEQDPAQIAQLAYLGAQSIEIARHQHRDVALVNKVCEPFPDALVTQLKKEREINWVHVIDGDQRKGFLAELTGDRLKNKKISEEGFATDFEADAHRATFDFDFGGKGIQRVEGGQTGDAKHLLDLMSKGNKTVKATLSKLINQNGIAMPMEGYGSASYNPKMGNGDGPSAIIKESNAMGGRTNFENIYTLRDAPNNKVICEYDFVRAGDQLMINGSTIVPINRDLKIRGDASFENYAERRKVSIELDRKDLEKGIIKPKLITPPTVELHIKPDWGKLAMLNQEGKLNDFSA